MVKILFNQKDGEKSFQEMRLEYDIKIRNSIETKSTKIELANHCVIVNFGTKIKNKVLKVPNLKF
ncbi:hypothetical protein BpHYR1_023751 [Brachionus plicatilis]|uniref:Uncharacterized protein n=1 Tax=Brachionus plicatilis TaxID=10195 RepID=A0A3M7RQC8_BRAPC|nr:hypothetical protein BpHYR1_023751 [Brachionus plicatilis]